MAKMTVSIPDELLGKFKTEFPDINPTEVVRNGIIKKLKELKKFEKLKSEGKI